MVRQEIKKFYMDCRTHHRLECEAPCSLYSVLFEHGIIGDPTVCEDTSALASYSVGGCTFTADFEVTPLIMSMKNVYMRLRGIDTLCRVEINGKEIAVTDNMHRTYDFEIKTKVDVGMNTLKLTFTKPQRTPDLRRAYGLFGDEDSGEIYDMGILRGIEIIAFNHKIISDVRVKQTHSDKSVRLDIKVNTVGYDDLSRAVATMTSPAGNVYFCGFVGGEGSITVNDPNLWWPNGLGMQNLYKLNVNLYSDSELEDTYEMKIGLRTVAMSSENGRHTLLVNGSPMLAMGAEYMLDDLLLSRSNEQRTRAMLEDAKRANFNTVFIHGSGTYPENYFLDACDELGLAVWMKIPVCDADREDSESFKAGILAELRDNLTRMSHHPSLAVVLGNERIYRLFTSDEDRENFAGGFSDFDGMNVFDLAGECDSHFVRIGHDSLPTYNSVLSFTMPENRNLGSRLFESHGAGCDTVMNMLSGAYAEYPYANGMRELSYVSGMHAAEASMCEAQAARRENPKPMGVLMRSMNEPWPSLSPVAVDYYGGRKPLHYYERDFFAPVRISVVVKGTRAKFVVSNDTRQDYVGVFAYSVMNNKNQAVFRDSFPIKARPSSNLEVHNVDLGSAISGHEDEYYLLYSVADKTNDASKGIHLFTKTKRFKFLKPTYTTEVAGTGMEFVVTVGADCLVKGVEISFDGVEYSLDKNYFDITGRAPVRIRMSTPRMTSVETLKRLMKIRSVCDLGTEG